jgi:hypothetical protein
MIPLSFLGRPIGGRLFKSNKGDDFCVEILRKDLSFYLFYIILSLLCTRDEVLYEELETLSSPASALKIITLLLFLSSYSFNNLYLSLDTILVFFRHKYCWIFTCLTFRFYKCAWIFLILVLAFSPDSILLYKLSSCHILSQFDSG